MATGRLSKKDFEVFKKECWKWIDILGLQSWEWNFVFGDCDHRAKAEYAKTIDGRGAKIYLNEQWFVEDNNLENIKKCAFHEVFEFLLSELRELALRDAPFEKVEEATHRVVRTLENVLFPKY